MMDISIELDKNDDLNNNLIDINEFDVPSFSIEIFNKNKILYNKFNKDNITLFDNSDYKKLYSTFFSSENDLLNINFIEKENNYNIVIDENEENSFNQNKFHLNKKENNNIVNNKKQKEKKKTFLNLVNNYSKFVQEDDFIKLISSKRVRNNLIICNK